MLQVGFYPSNPIAHRLFNFMMAALLVLLSAPLFIIICLLLYATQGREIFYCGPRLGEGQKTFNILKFRTLCSKRASAMTRNCPLPRDARIETPLGGALRDSRLDELPQLFNILKGDMNICGPRPVRPEIAAIERERIPGYDLRFAVKPGLIGPTQACFGHATSKRIRARMNNRLVMRPVSLMADLVLLARIGWSVLSKVGAELGRVALRSAAVSLPDRRPDIWLANQRGERLGAVEAIGATTFRATGLPGSMAGERAVLHVRLRSGALRKARILISRCGDFGMFSYAAETEYGAFVIERYALGLVVLPPKLETIPVEREAAQEWDRACA